MSVDEKNTNSEKQLQTPEETLEEIDHANESNERFIDYQAEIRVKQEEMKEEIGNAEKRGNELVNLAIKKEAVTRAEQGEIAEVNSSAKNEMSKAELDAQEAFKNLMSVVNDLKNEGLDKSEYKEHSSYKQAHEKWTDLKEIVKREDIDIMTDEEVVKEFLAPSNEKESITSDSIKEYESLETFKKLYKKDSFHEAVQRIRDEFDRVILDVVTPRNDQESEHESNSWIYRDLSQEIFVHSEQGEENLTDEEIDNILDSEDIKREIVYKQIGAEVFSLRDDGKKINKLLNRLKSNNSENYKKIEEIFMKYPDKEVKDLSYEDLYKLGGLIMQNLKNEEVEEEQEVEEQDGEISQSAEEAETTNDLGDLDQVAEDDLAEIYAVNPEEVEKEMSLDDSEKIEEEIKTVEGIDKNDKIKLSADDVLKGINSNEEEKTIIANSLENVIEDINKMNEQEKISIFEGVANISSRINIIKNKAFEKVFKTISYLPSKLLKNQNVVNRYLKEYQRSYEKTSKKSQKDIDLKGKGFLKNTGTIGQGLGTIFKYSRATVDLATMGSARALNPFRHATAVAMFVGKTSEVAKETRLTNEEVGNRNRIGKHITNFSDAYGNKDESLDDKEVLNLMDDARKMYDEAKKGDDAPSTEDLAKIYRRRLPEEIMERFNKIGYVEAGFLNPLLTRDAKIYVDRIANKINGINESELSDNEKQLEIDKILLKNNEILDDLDRMVSDTAGVDTIAYLSRVMEKTGKGVATALVIDSAHRLAKMIPEYSELLDKMSFKFFDSFKGDSNVDTSDMDSIQEIGTNNEVDVNKSSLGGSMTEVNKGIQEVKSESSNVINGGEADLDATLEDDKVLDSEDNTISSEEILNKKEEIPVRVVNEAPVEESVTPEPSSLEKGVSINVDYIKNSDLNDVLKNSLLMTSEENQLKSFEILSRLGGYNLTEDQIKSLTENINDPEYLKRNVDEVLREIGDIHSTREGIKAGDTFTKVLGRALRGDGVDDKTREAFINKVNDLTEGKLLKGTEITDKNINELTKKAITRLSVANLDGVDHKLNVSNLIYEGNTLKVNSETGEWSVEKGDSEYEAKSVEGKELRENANKMKEEKEVNLKKPLSPEDISGQTNKDEVKTEGSKNKKVIDLSSDSKEMSKAKEVIDLAGISDKPQEVSQETDGVDPDSTSIKNLKESDIETLLNIQIPDGEVPEVTEEQEHLLLWADEYGNVDKFSAVKNITDLNQKLAILKLFNGNDDEAINTLVKNTKIVQSGEFTNVTSHLSRKGDLVLNCEGKKSSWFNSAFGNRNIDVVFNKDGSIFIDGFGGFNHTFGVDDNTSLNKKLDKVLDILEKIKGKK